MSYVKVSQVFNCLYKYIYVVVLKFSHIMKYTLCCELQQILSVGMQDMVELSFQSLCVRCVSSVTACAAVQ